MGSSWDHALWVASGHSAQGELYIPSIELIRADVVREAGVKSRYPHDSLAPVRRRHF